MEAINYLLLFLVRLEIVCNKIYVLMTREASLVIRGGARGSISTLARELSPRNVICLAAALAPLILGGRRCGRRKTR